MRIVNNPREIDGIKVAKNYDEVMEALKNNEQVMHFEFGDSMKPLLKSGEYALIKPCVPFDVKRGDAVFCVLSDSVGNRYPMVHQVWEISNASHDGGLWFKIGSTMSTIFGWTQDVYGIAKGTDIYQEITDEIRESWKEYETANSERR